MTPQLNHIQTALKGIVMRFIEAQRMNLEGVYQTKINAAETHLRVIANKRAPYLIFHLMQQLHVTEVIEFEQPVASAEYVVQIIGSITRFESIWEDQLARYGSLAKVQLILNELDELLAEAERNAATLQIQAVKSKV